MSESASTPSTLQFVTKAEAKESRHLSTAALGRELLGWLGGDRAPGGYFFVPGPFLALHRPTPAYTLGLKRRT